MNRDKLKSLIIAGGSAIVGLAILGLWWIKDNKKTTRVKEKEGEKLDTSQSIDVDFEEIHE